MSDQKLKIIPLGGLGEFGMNSMAIRYGDDIIVVDAGMMFPDDELLGVDIVTPDFSYLEQNAAHVRGLILMDLQMPDINGFEAAAKIRLMNGYQDVPILALTASCSDQVKEQCRAIGMKAFLSKPIDANELWSAVSRYLGREIPRQ